MSTVDCAVITNLGHALLGKVLAGKSGIHFTRASVGDGVISEGKSPEELTELVHEIKAGDISGVDNPGSGEVRVSIQVSSLGVSVGFFVKEIGIFATDPDLGEILYAYVGMPDKPQWIRPEGASINTLAIFDVYVAVSRAAEVTAQICPSAMVHISDFESYKTYVETQLSNKAEAKFTLLSSRPQTAQEFWALEPGKYTWVQTAPYAWQPEDTPSGNLRVALIMERGKPGAGTVYADMAYTDGGTSLRRYTGEPASNNEGVRWARLATAVAPSKYNLQMVSGWTARAGYSNHYSKDQFGRVTIQINITNSKTPPDLTLAAVLPAGYRPSDITVAAAHFQTNGEAHSGVIKIQSDGNLYLGHSISTSNGVTCASQISFYAAN